LQLQHADGRRAFGVAQDDSLERAALKALLAGANRLIP